MKTVSRGLLGFLGIGLSVNLWAAEAVTPLEGRHGGKAGESVEGSFLITNILLADVDVAVSLADYPNAGVAVPLSKGTDLSLASPANFRLKAGENRSVRYRVTFPTPFDHPAVGAIALVIRKSGDSLSTPLINRLLPIFVQPRKTDAVLKVELDQPNIRLSAATAEVGGPQYLEVSVLVRNLGNDAVRPQGRVDFHANGQTIETLALQGTETIPAGATAIYSGRTQRTGWPNGGYKAAVTLEYGDYYSQPLKLEKAYFFRISGETISVHPGSATPSTVNPR